MKPNAKRILTISMIAVTVLWVIAIAALYISALEEVWGLLAFVLIVPYFAPLLIGILAILHCVRSILSEKQTGELGILNRFTTVTTTLFGVLSLVTLLLWLCRSWEVFSDTNPLGMLYADGVLTRMTFAFTALTLLCALIGGVGRIFIRKLSPTARPRLPQIVCTTVIVLFSVITLCVLFIPVPAGSYNDGGSKIYEAVLYDVVDWNRTQHFDGTPFHEDNQRMRIYFFPQNCYDYDKRWQLRH